MLLAIGQMASACHGPLTSPTGQSMPCEELLETDLVGKAFDPMSDEDAHKWILERYGVQASAGADYGDFHSFYWRTNGKYYDVLISNNGFSLAMVWETGFPAVRQVLDCLGDPEYYRAYLDPTPGPTFTQLILLYPSQGLSFGVTIFEPVDAFEFSAPVKSVSYYEPGTLEDATLASAKPWPGSLDRISVDPRPSR